MPKNSLGPPPINRWRWMTLCLCMSLPLGELTGLGSQAASQLFQEGGRDTEMLWEQLQKCLLSTGGISRPPFSPINQTLQLEKLVSPADAHRQVQRKRGRCCVPCEHNHIQTPILKVLWGSSHCGSEVTNPTSIQENEDSIPHPD